MKLDDDSILPHLLERLAAASADQIELEELDAHELSRPMYRARCGNRWTYVDRPLAIRLRERGASWTGEVLRDPLAVA